MRTLRRVAPAILLALLVAPTPALAAQRADITGIVTNETQGEPQPNVKVTLIHFERGRQSPERETARTDEQGRYVFAGVPTGEDHLYSIDVFHQGGLFQGGNHQIPDNTEQKPEWEVDVSVWDTTDDPQTILLRRNDVFLVPGDTSVSVVDSYRIVNTTDLAYIGRGGAGSQSVMSFPLPNATQRDTIRILNEPRVGVPELIETEFGFGIPTAIPPGETDFQFSYLVDGSGGSYELSRTALYPILDTAVFVQEPLELDSNRLTERGPVDVGEDAYIRYATDETIDAGDPIQLLAVAQAGTSPWLFVGAFAGMALLGVLAYAGVALRKRLPTRPTIVTSTSGVTSPHREREDTIVAIAELDLRYRNGDIEESEWRDRREQLKAGVRERSPEPTP